MEAVAAIGLASNILQFLEFSFKLLRTASEVKHSAARTTAEVETSANLLHNLRYYADRIEAPEILPAADEGDKRLADIAKHCRETCVELQAIIEWVNDVQASRVRNIRVAWRAMRQSGKLESTRARLNWCQRQMMDHILFTLSGRQTSALNSLKSIESSIGSTRKEILEQLTQLRSNVVQAKNAQPQDHLSNSPSKQIQQALLTINSSLHLMEAEDKFVEWLAFPEMRSREAMIGDSHGDTFRWLLYDVQDEGTDLPCIETDPSVSVSISSEVPSHDSGSSYHDEERPIPHAITSASAPSEEAMRQQKRLAFQKWLKEKQDLFYISGKAGSGKSTLMKFLAREPQTRHHLEEWAGEKRLILISRFFWAPGSSLQKSIQGLYRGILWEILRSAPEHSKDIALAFGANGAGFFNSPHHRPYIEPELKALEQALKTLMDGRLSDTYSICLFIDGLDEFDGDYWKLAQHLKKWSLAPGFKVCCSSRPYLQFHQTFISSIDCWLQLHELTRPDMMRFVVDTFQNDPRFTEAQSVHKDYNDLVAILVDRSDGIFLWLQLVVNVVLGAVEHHYSFEQLRTKIYSTPKGLDAVFHQMLDRIERSDRRKVSQTLQALILFNSMGNQPTHLYLQGVVDDLDDDAGLGKRILKGLFSPIKEEKDCVMRCQVAGRRILSRSHGLLEVIPTGDPFPECHQLQLIHRTLHDFLSGPDMQQELHKLTPKFLVGQNLACGLLAFAQQCSAVNKVSCSYGTPVPEVKGGGILATWLQLLLQILAWTQGPDDDADNTSLTAVDLIEKIMLETFEEWIMSQIRFPRPAFGLSTIAGWRWELVRPEHLSSIIYAAGAGHEAQSYVRSKTRQQPGLLHSGTYDVFLMASLNDLFSNKSFSGSLTEFLLDQKPDLNRERSTSCELHAFKSIEKGASTYDKVDTEFHLPTPPWTRWTLFLLHMELGGPTRERYGNEDSPPRLNRARYLEAFLEHGADPTVCFVGYVVTTNPPVQGRYVDPALGTTHEKSGPFFATLEMMLSIWGMSPSARLQTLLTGRPEGWLQTVSRLVGRSWMSRGGEQDIKPLDMDTIRQDDSAFVVLKVTPRAKMKDIPLQELEKSSPKRLNELLREGWPDITILS